MKVVVGTRAAAFAPVRDLGLVALWDDGDDLYAEPRAPYPHTREVLLIRAHEEGRAALVGGFARTVEAEYLLRTGWAHEIAADRATLRAHAPQVGITGATDRELERDPHARTARLPREAYDAIRDGLAQGPVLLQTPRQGYATFARLRPLPHPRPLPGLHRPAAAAAAAPAAVVPLVRHRAARLGVCRVRRPRAAGAGRGGAAHRRGARPGVPARAGAHLGRRPGAGHRRRPCPRVVVATPGAEPVAEAATPAWCCSTPG